MLFDNITLLNGSKLENVVVAGGSSFPSSPDAGELFFKTTDNKLYVYDGTNWTAVGSGSGSFTVTGDVTGSLDNGTGSLTLETVNSNVGTYGSAGSVSTVTVNAKGLVTAASETAISIAPSQISTAVPIAKGGTGQTTAAAAAAALLPSQTGNAGKYLLTNGTALSWQFPAGGTVTSVDISGGATGLSVTGGPVTTSGSLTLSGVLAVAAGGTGQTTTTGALNALLPNQVNKDGLFLRTDGTNAAWEAIPSTVVTGALGYTPMNKAGDTMSGLLTLSADPSQDLHAATKRYVDNVAAGINILGACRSATGAPLSATYSNGASGVGATLTGSSALPSIGGINLAVGERVLIKNQASALENGIYVVTTATNPWVLTRATDYDGRFAGAIDAGDTVFIQEGDLAGTLWVQNATGALTIGTSALSWTQFSGPGSYSAGTGIGVTNNVISNAGVLSLTAGANVAVSASTGAVTVSFDGTLPILSGGTGQTTAQAALNALAGATTQNRVLQGNGTNIVLGQVNLGTDTVTGTLPITAGGTGQITAAAAAAALLPSQTANAGKFLYTDGSGLSWVGISVEGAGGALQFNNAGSFDGTAQISYNATDTLTVGDANSTFKITGANDAEGLTILAGRTLGGANNLVSDGQGGLTLKNSSTLTLSGGQADELINPGGNAVGSMKGGNVVIAGGISANSTGGSVIIKTAASNSLTDRLKIDSSGTWYVNGTAGTAGYVLTSGGPGVAPSWALSINVTSVDVSGGSTGLTTSGGPITSSGTITLGGTLAIANGGTGQTTASAAINALLPAQAGNMGKFLTTDGTSASWVPAQGAGTVTSVDASGGTTGMTFTGGPILAGGTLTLGGTLAIAAGGTGQTTAQAALNALAGGVTNNRVLIGNGSAITLGQISLTSDAVTGTLPISAGGTGQTTAGAAINALVPSQSGKTGQYLTTDGTTVSWSAVTSVGAAGQQGDVQFNDGGVASGTTAVQIVSDVLTLAQDALINGIRVGKGPGAVTTQQGAPFESYNTAFGVSALASSNYSTYNVGVGYQALNSIINSSNNTAVGASAAQSITNGANNTVVGFSALLTNQVGSYNVAVGANALRSAGVTPLGAPAASSSNTAVGASALRLTNTGSENTSVGDSSLYKNTSGGGNVAVGYFALTNNTTSSDNVAIGKNALYSSFGAGNTAIGTGALYANTAGSNNVAIGNGAGANLTNGDDNVIIGRHAGEPGIASTVIISAGTTQRLRFNDDGAIEIVEGTGYGTSGHVLTSAGAGAPPTWSAPTTGTVTSVAISGGSTGLTTSGGPITSNGTITLGGTLAIAAGGTGQTTASDAINALVPSQTDNSGKYLTTDGSVVSWGSIPSVATLSNSSVLGTTENAAVSITGKASTSGASAPMTIAAGSSAAGSPGNSLTLSGGAGPGSANGGAVTIKSGDTSASGGSSGSITMHTDSVGISGSVTIRGGDSSGNGVTGGGGSLTLRGGDSTNGSTGATTGNVTIRGGNAAATTTGGSVTISGGTSPAGGGAVIFQTGASSSLAERFRITKDGAWSIGSDGTSYGTSGQVLTSNGNAAPTWQTVSSLPSQTGNSGKYLTTDGTTASWATVSASLSGVSAFGASYNEVDSTITASATTTIDCSLSNNFSISLAASITTLSFTNVPAAGRLYCATLFLAQDSAGSKTVVWPGSFKWAGGTAPTLTTAGSKTDIITIVTRDGGSNWFAMVAGQNF